MSQFSTTDLVAAAAQGEQEAWNTLVARYERLVWAVVRGHGICGTDAADISQTAWLRLVEHLGRLREPEQVGAWLAATARHECVRWLRHRSQERVMDEVPDRPAGEPDPEERALAADEAHLLVAALERLPERCRILLRMLAADPPASYTEISAALGLPVGSIGPTRSRCLARLREIASSLGLDLDSRTSAEGGR
ncbi:MAG: sigma-70 family RNA polymerase sigma factor [Acidothermus sp.]|nr:sigma-70 family RNA polymerase sigma factor [Acidothermus sp.]MCL6537155.1 sigma-70 family RNA polymerase sigma factor [Acidothermus sp.]